MKCPKNKMINKKIKEIGDALPHGAKKEISKLSGISEQTVVKYFKGLRVKSEIALKIHKAAQVYIDKAIETELEIQGLTKAQANSLIK